MDIQYIDVVLCPRRDPQSLDHDQVWKPTARCPACDSYWLDLESYNLNECIACPHLQFVIEPEPDSDSGLWCFNGFRVSMLSEVVIDLIGEDDDGVKVSTLDNASVARYLINNRNSLSFWKNLETLHFDTILMYEDYYGPNTFTTFFGIKMDAELPSLAV